MIIYKVTNKINSKIYIGQSHFSLAKRKSVHLATAKILNKSIPFHLAIRKYGRDNFIWEVIDTAVTQEELNEKECFYITDYRSSISDLGYNLKTGGSYGRHHEFTKLKIAATKKGIPRSLVTKIKLKKAMLGKKATETAKQKMSKARTGCNNHMWGKHHSTITKQKIAAAHRGKKLTQEYKDRLRDRNSKEGNPFFGKVHTLNSKILMANKRGKKIICTTTNKTFNSVFEASILLAISKHGINSVLQKRHLNTKKLHFEYLENYANT